MEPLWSPVVATGRNRSQIARAEKPGKQAKTVAVGCDRLPIGRMVRRGSPVRVRKGSAKAPTAGNVYPRNVVVAGRRRRVNLSPKSGSNAASSLIDRCCPAELTAAARCIVVGRLMLISNGRRPFGPGQSHV